MDALLGRVVGGIDLTPERGLVEAFANAVDRAQPTKRLMWAVPIVVVDPYGQLFADIRCSGINRRPELLEDGALRALDLPIRFCQLSRQLDPGLVAGSATDRLRVG